MTLTPEKFSGMNETLFLLSFGGAAYATYLLIALADIWRINRQIKALYKWRGGTTPVVIISGESRPGFTRFE